MCFSQFSQIFPTPMSPEVVQNKIGISHSPSDLSLVNNDGWQCRLTTRLPVMRCEGVIGSSKSQEETYFKGLELMMDSTSTTAVCSSSSEKSAWPINFLRQCLVLTTSHSKTAHHQGALSILNSYSIPKVERRSITVWCLKTRSRKTVAAFELLSLSDRNFLGIPLLAANCLRHLMSMLVDMSGTNSKCMPHVTQHVKRRILTLLTRFDRVYSGPA